MGELSQLSQLSQPLESPTAAPGGDAAIGEGDSEAREAFEERAAIMEYDGGLSRAEAERLAGELTRPAGVASDQSHLKVPARAGEWAELSDTG